MLIEKDKGYVELSVSLAETWPVSAGPGSGGSQEGSWACQLLSTLLSVYLSAHSLVAEGLCLFSYDD